MECPWLGDVVSSAIKKCPFLGQLAEDKGEAYARSFAVNPRRPASGPIFPESLTDFSASFQLFHGASGVVPLVRTEQPARAEDLPQHGLSNSQTAGFPPNDASKPAGSVGQQPTIQRSAPGCPLSAAPFASVTSGVFKFLPGPDDFIARLRQRRKERGRDRRPPRKQQSNKPSRARARNRQPGLERWRTHPIVGGLIPLNAAGQYVCPPLVVAGRQAVARLKSVQLLRPQRLPVKLLGVGAQCLAANVPAGMVREHTEKFSAAWFLAVHATVPFFAFMRKGVGMPKWAMLLTLAAAVTGQALGVRLERHRLKLHAESNAASKGLASGPSKQSMICSLAAERAGNSAYQASSPLTGSLQTHMLGFGSVTAAA